MKKAMVGTAVAVAILVLGTAVWAHNPTYDDRSSTEGRAWVSPDAQGTPGWSNAPDVDRYSGYPGRGDYGPQYSCGHWYRWMVPGHRARCYDFGRRYHDRGNYDDYYGGCYGGGCC